MKRMRIFSLTSKIGLSLLVFVSCSNIKEPKNRTQLVADLSYRTLVVPDSLRKKIENEVYQIVSERSSEELKLFYRKMNETAWQEREGRWEGVEELRKSSLDEWKSDDLESSVIIFPTTLTDPMQSKVMEVVGIEYEHRALTGTCVILAAKTEGRTIYFDYIERK